MDLSLPEAAARLGVTPQRAHAMLRSGQLSGRKVGGRWVIDDSQLLQPRRLSRPFSQRMAWAAVIGTDQADWLTQPERSKLRSRLNRIRNRNEGPQLLASWLASRSPLLIMSAPEPGNLAGDPDVVPSGVSDERSGMWGGGQYEFYAQPGTLETVIARHMLVEDPAGTVRLRETPIPLEAPVPLLLLAADLADHGGSRENRRSLELIAQALT